MPLFSKKESKVLQIANYFIYKNNENPKPDFTNKKLQKLIYYSQAWNLVFNDKKLFDDKIEAWIHGPSIPAVYREFKVYGFSQIKRKVSKEDFKNLSEKEKEILDSVWNVYGKYDSSYLEALTHSEHPWLKARAQLKPYESSSNEISIDDLKQYYGRKKEE